MLVLTHFLNISFDVLLSKLYLYVYFVCRKTPSIRKTVVVEISVENRTSNEWQLTENSKINWTVHYCVYGM